MMILNRFKLVVYVSLISAGCSPLKSSPHDQRHQMELTLHEVQTNLDDLRHDIHCFKTELQILDGRIKHSEQVVTNLKQQEFEKQQTKIEQLSVQLQALEKRWALSEKARDIDTQELRQLTSYAKETSAALIQFKKRLEELEKDLIIGQRKLEEFGKIKGNIEHLTKSLLHDQSFQRYKVRSGDSLKKIAKLHNTSVEKIKKLNDLNPDQDLIVVGQELLIPSD